MSIRVQKIEVIFYRCRKCPGLYLDEDQLDEHRAYHVREKARKREAQQDTAPEVTDEIVQRKSNQRTKRKSSIRTKAVSRQKILKEKRAKLEKVLKEAEKDKARKDRNARTKSLIRKRESVAKSTSEAKQNFVQERDKGSRIVNRSNKRVFVNQYYGRAGNEAGRNRPIRSCRRYADGLARPLTISG